MYQNAYQQCINYKDILIYNTLYESYKSIQKNLHSQDSSRPISSFLPILFVIFTCFGRYLEQFLWFFFQVYKWIWPHKHFLYNKIVIHILDMEYGLIFPAGKPCPSALAQNVWGTMTFQPATWAHILSKICVTNSPLYGIVDLIMYATTYNNYMLKMLLFSGWKHTGK